MKNEATLIINAFQHSLGQNNKVALNAFLLIPSLTNVCMTKTFYLRHYGKIRPTSFQIKLY